jgi:hypothetical protein
MANIKLNLEANVSEEVVSKFIEVLEKAEKPPEEIQVELSDVSGKMTIRLVQSSKQ